MQELSQIWTIARLQLSRVFFSKRSFWVYGLALFPSLIFFGHGVEVKYRRANAISHKSDPAALDAIRQGDTPEEVLKAAGTPARDQTFSFNRRVRSKIGKGGVKIEEKREEVQSRYMQYFDGNREFSLNFEGGFLQSKNIRNIINFDEDRRIYAGVFQFFYLRLAIFFGCLGIFMNLFRGEMLDKTLHFWFLVPARREVLLLGKYVAGLIASVTIFGLGAALCYAMMLWPQDPAAASAFWQEQGASNMFWYAATAALGCVGYGSVFLAAGLLLRNPIIPAITISLWEGINGILPSAIQKLSVLYYVQSLSPVPPPMDENAPVLIRLLFSPADPPSTLVAVAGLLALTAFVLWAASRAVKKLEINYGTE